MSILLSRWSYSLLGVVLLAAVVVYLGPLWAPLEDLLPRILLVAFMLLAWVTGNLMVSLSQRARDNALARGVSGGVSAEAAGERAAIEAKLLTAMNLLKKARGTKGYLYEQPWYAIIGPPGAGKTTALLNAGLEFPLAKEMGRGAVAGVGGTRLCEWWFTDQAVMIDTAGRYTTHDSDAAIDRAGWDAFLDLLKTTRPEQPLNGVIVAIALSDIASASARERSAHAEAIRARIDELERKFGMRLPVYAVFTKADLLSGFMEFFDDLDREGRAQVWGTTFAWGAPVSETVGGFAASFRALVERVALRLADRLQAEPSPERRALIAGFPTQMASLEAPLDSFVREAFGESASGPAPLLRGVYLTSATQEGTPIDRITGAISRAFGLAPQRAAQLRPQEGRTYFLTHVLRDVVFGEAMLVHGGRKRRGAGMGLAIAGGVAALVVLGAAGVLWGAYAGAQGQIRAGAAELDGYAQAAARLPLDPVNDADLNALAPLLDKARAALPADDQARLQGEIPTQTPVQQAAWWSVFSQQAKVDAGRRAVYRHLLEHAFFPRLIWRLEAQLRGNLNNPDFLYEATRIYLMLGGQGPLDRGTVKEWMAADWQATYPGAELAPLRESLGRHLGTLLAEPLPPIVLDGELVAQARATFGRVSLAQRVYARIKPSAAAQLVQPWKPIDSLGAVGGLVFTRASGKPLDEGVPGFFTIGGFHTVLLPSLPQAAQEVASEGWVLGQNVTPDPQSPEMQMLQRDVINLYMNDYARAWDGMLADLTLTPLRSLTQAAQGLYILASLDQSPMKSLLVSVARQLTLSEPPEAVQAAQQRQMQAQMQASGLGLNARFGALLGARTDTAARPGHEIDERYRALREVAGTGGPAPIDRTLRTLGDLQQQLAKLAAAGVRAGSSAPAAAGEDPALALQADAAKEPQPIQRWLNIAAGSGVALRSGDPKMQVVAAWNVPGGPAQSCQAVVNGRYPFTANAAEEIGLDDFARVFAPGGLLDGFFNTMLKPYVNTKASPWTPMAAEGTASPVSGEAAGMFQRAAQIRDLFFPEGRAIPTVRFDIAPVSLAPRAASRVTLDIDGTSVSFSRGPARATEITWPGGAIATHAASLAFDPPPPAGTWQEGGAWAMFRLFARGKIAPGNGADRIALSFQNGDRQAGFELRTPRNPFAANVLQGFRCPVIQ